MTLNRELSPAFGGALGQRRKRFCMQERQRSGAEDLNLRCSCRSAHSGSCRDPHTGQLLENGVRRERQEVQTGEEMTNRMTYIWGLGHSLWHQRFHQLMQSCILVIVSFFVSSLVLAATLCIVLQGSFRRRRVWPVLGTMTFVHCLSGSLTYWLVCPKVCN